MRCSKCAAEIQPGEQFCGECGARAEPGRPAPSSGGRGWVWILGLLLVAGLGGLGWLWMQGKRPVELAQAPGQGAPAAQPAPGPVAAASPGAAMPAPPPRTRSELEEPRVAVPVPKRQPASPAAPGAPQPAAPATAPAAIETPAPAVTVAREAAPERAPEGAAQTPAAAAPSGQAIVTEPAYIGPRSGVINWSGRLEKNELMTIEGDRATSGQLSGRLPGVPVLIELDHREFAVAEAPAPINGWNRLAVRSRNRRHTVISIRWTVIE